MTSKNVIPVLLGVLAVRQGTVTNLAELTVQTGLTDQQVKSGMYRIIRGGKWPVEVIQQGHLWKIGTTDTAVEVDDNTITFDVVEHAGHVMVIADAAGALWVARRIGALDG